MYIQVEAKDATLANGVLVIDLDEALRLAESIKTVAEQIRKAARPHRSATKRLPKLVVQHGTRTARI